LDANLQRIHKEINYFIEHGYFIIVNVFFHGTPTLLQWDGTYDSSLFSPFKATLVYLRSLGRLPSGQTGIQGKRTLSGVHAI